jgi:hypothetical protein|tara:strand:+ start:784 stop:1809 length:1026 start_codon:yes stop_codon:yes gene_type:complete
LIKIKIPNPFQGRNEPTFRPLFFAKDVLKDYSIEITESDDFDYLFIGMHDFMNKKVSLTESIEYGLNNLSKISGDYFLFEGTDSTSLMGAYEVFEQSDAIYLFKNQMLGTREEYKVPYVHNKWFWGSGSDLDLSYDIPEDRWNRIKFSGWNIGYLVPGYRQFQPINESKGVDVCAIFQGKHKYNEDHTSRNDHFYTAHRNGLWEMLEPLKQKYNMIYDRLPFEEYIKNLWNSKISLSPFGMGEICFRDFECMQYGTIILKPEQSKVKTIPTIYEEGVTYIGTEYDFSDLEEKIDYILTNFDKLNMEINTNIREQYATKYTYENLGEYWYNLFKNLDNVEEE